MSSRFKTNFKPRSPLGVPKARHEGQGRDPRFFTYTPERALVGTAHQFPKNVGSAHPTLYLLSSILQKTQKHGTINNLNTK